MSGASGYILDYLNDIENHSGNFWEVREKGGEKKRTTAILYIHGRKKPPNITQEKVPWLLSYSALSNFVIFFISMENFLKIKPFKNHSYFYCPISTIETSHKNGTIIGLFVG